MVIACTQFYCMHPVLCNLFSDNGSIPMQCCHALFPLFSFLFSPFLKWQNSSSSNYFCCMHLATLHAFTCSYSMAISVKIALFQYTWRFVLYIVSEQHTKIVTCMTIHPRNALKKHCQLAKVIQSLKFHYVRVLCAISCNTDRDIKQLYDLDYGLKMQGLR